MYGYYSRAGYVGVHMVNNCSGAVRFGFMIKKLRVAESGFNCDLTWMFQNRTQRRPCTYYQTMLVQNYVDKTLAFFDCPSPSVDIFYLMTVEC